MDQTTEIDRFGGERQGSSLEVTGDRLETAFVLRIQEPEGARVEKGGVEVVGDVEDAVEGQLPAEVPQKRNALRQETQPRPDLAREAGAVGGKGPFRIGEAEPVEDQHAERVFPGERPDGLAGAEAAKLKPGLEEKAVAGNRTGEQVDALVRGVLAFQEEKRVGVPSPGQAFEDSRPRKPGADLLPVEPAEEKVPGVFARELE